MWARIPQGENMKKGMQLLGVVLLGVLAGCALSPQQVELHPTLQTDQAGVLGRNQALRVTGNDQRESPVIGSRGGLYDNTSLIRATNDVAGNLAALVRNHLQSRGFNTLNASSGAPELAINLVALSYTPAEGYVINRVVVAASIQAVLTGPASDSFSRTYTSSVTFEQPISPTAERNQAMLDEVLSRCVAQLAKDSLLLDKLQDLPVPTH